MFNAIYSNSFTLDSPSYAEEEKGIAVCQLLPIPSLKSGREPSDGNTTPCWTDYA